MRLKLTIDTPSNPPQAGLPEIISEIPTSKLLPAIRFHGSSQQHDGIQPLQGNGPSSFVRGVVQLTADNPPQVRWTLVIRYGGEDRWRLECVQVGGRGSKRGFFGVSTRERVCASRLSNVDGIADDRSGQMRKEKNNRHAAQSGIGPLAKLGRNEEDSPLDSVLPLYLAVVKLCHCTGMLVVSDWFRSVDVFLMLGPYHVVPRAHIGMSSTPCHSVHLQLICATVMTLSMNSKFGFPLSLFCPSYN